VVSLLSAGLGPPVFESSAMSLRRRLVHGSLIVSLLLAAMPPGPAGATSTASEVEMAKEEEKSVLNQYNVVTDPLLNAWVNEVGEKVWGQVARRDVPYNIKILDASDINSFTIGGGYIYVNKGLLDFVQSDDELAGVIGHETGHNERRHTLTLPAKAQALNLLFGVASLFSPFIYRFGQIAEAGIIAKQERADELQADQYGLLLMTRAGYDPEAMLSFMQHMGAAESEHDSAVDKYLADHPGFPSRVSHLVGYDELDPTKRTNDELLGEALHDQDEARYNIAAMKYTRVLKADPNNPIALLHMGQSEIALGETGKSEQTLGQAAQAGTPETRMAALSSIKSLQQSEAHFTLEKPSLAPLREELANVQAREAEAAAALQLRRDAGRDLIKAVDSRIQNISYGMPDLSRVPVRPGGRLDAILKNFGSMSRAIDASFTKSSATIAGVGTLEKNKESGLIKENDEILTELASPLAFDPVPVESLSVLPAYPRMFDDLALTDGDMIRALDASRSSLALLDVALGDLNDFIDRLSHSQMDFQGDVSQSDYNSLVPLMQKSADGLNRAAIAGSQAEQLFNLARSRQLQTRITMLGLGYPQDRYATLQTALQDRVKNDGVSFDTMLHDDLTPGEVAAASIVAADTNTTPEAIIEEAVTSNRRIVDVANARGMSSTALEIFLGLVYLDYTDDPVKEAKGH
jgi:predicted Zn-dependent protease